MADKKKELSKKEIAEYRASFQLFDTDGDGQLTGDEIEKMFQAAGLNPTKQEIENIMTMGDKDGNRSLDFDEFLQLLRACNLPRDPKEREAELIEAFNRFDTNGDGFIDRGEFRKIMKHGGESVEEIDKLMDEYDVNKDGRLEYKEYFTNIEPTNESDGETQSPVKTHLASPSKLETRSRFEPAIGDTDIHLALLITEQQKYLQKYII